MSGSRAPKNNVLAGLFVLLCIGLAMICIIALSNISDRFVKRTPYIVRFSVADGAEGLEAGSAVKLGGKRVGAVTKVEFTPDDGEPQFVDVSVEIDRKIKVYDDADVQLIKPILGSGSSINISSGGEVVPESLNVARAPRLLGQNTSKGQIDTISGRLGAPGFVAPTDYTRLQNIIARVDRISAQTEPRIAEIMSDAQAAVADVRNMAADARAVVGDARQSWPTWKQQVADVLTRIDVETKKFEGIGPAFFDAVAEGKLMFDRAIAVVDENRPAINEAIESVRQITVKFNEKGYDEFMALLTEARETVISAKSIATQTDRLLTEKIPEVSEIVTSAAIAAQQLKLATAEIRAAPWRLLYQPTKKELENELLYNSVRQYASSVGELKAAAEALKAMSDRAGGSSSADARVVTQAELAALSAKLKAAFDQYQVEERQFLDRWVKSDK